MDFYIGELRLFGFNFAPLNWALCDGSLLPIAKNQALFALLGTMYGGDGTSTFALPDLRGRVPLGMGAGPGLTPHHQGEPGGHENVTLTVAQLAPHSHPVHGSAQASGKSPANLAPGFSAGGAVYGTPDDTLMSPAMVGPTGGAQPVPVSSPYLALNWCIALTGVFPSRP